MNSYVTAEIIEKLFDSLKNRYQNNFDYVQLLYYKFYKINLNLCGSHIGCPYWIKNKKQQ